MKRLILGLLCLGMAYGATAHLYNLSFGQVLDAHFSRWSASHSKIWMVLPSGEKLTGEFSAVIDGSVGWGSLLGSVYGPAGTAGYNGTALGVRMNARREGEAILIGKTEMFRCEFVAGMGGHGIGACEDRSGTKYRLLF